MEKYFGTISACLERASGGVAVIAASIVSSSGSAPRAAGARMLIFPDGSSAGTIGGGRYEAEAQALARECCRIAMEGGDLPGADSAAAAGKPAGEEDAARALAMPVSLQGATDMDMICGGNVVILLELLEPAPGLRRIYAEAARLEAAGEGFAMRGRFYFPPEVLHADGAESLRRQSPLFRGWVEKFPPRQKAARTGGSEAESVLTHEENGLFLLEYFPALRHLHIFGAGHVSRALAQLGHFAGFACAVLDDRAEFASAARFPEAVPILLPSLGEADCSAYFDSVKPGRHHGIAILTRGHSHDRDVLAAALLARRKHGAGYIGMIGSGSKRARIYGQLADGGFAGDELSLVHSPIGLSIGAETPEEIAVSVMAQLIQWRRGKI